MPKLIKRKNRTNSDIAFDWLFNVCCFIILLLALYPMYFVLIASVSKAGNVLTGKVWLWPVDFTLEGYKMVFEDERIPLGYRNTLFYTACGTLFSLVCTLPAAYALSRKEMPARRFIMLLYSIPMFFGGGLIPTYLVVKQVGMLDTAWVFIIPWAVSTYNVIITRTFFTSNIPEELWEAARIDGCSYSHFFVRVVLPLSKAIIAVIGLYYAVGYWNEYYRALVYTKSAELAPLQMVLRSILLASQDSGSNMSNYAARLERTEAIKYALILVATLPVMAIYPFIQKYFTKGVMIGSIKG